MKFIKSIKENILSIFTLFLLFFIPLYPKLPVIGVSHTWVYVRLEDFVISAVLTLWIFLVLFKKVKLKTPLTIPIFLFWVVGAFSTLHGVLILFPTLPNVFSNVAFLSFVRHIEYLSLFFVAFTSVRDKSFAPYLLGTLSVTLVAIIVYGFGQRYLGLPAFLTGNEEFAKGTAIQLSKLARIPSTFAGHYDLAAYLVLIIPIFTSVAFAFRNLLLRLLFLSLSLLGFALLFLTVSRVSFFVLLISLLGLLIMGKRKIFAISLILFAIVFLIISPKLISRFQNTLVSVDVLVNAKTGEALSQVIEVPRSYFKEKNVLRSYAATESARFKVADIMLYNEIPDPALLLIRPNAPTGENLPQGTGYVNLELSPVIKRSSFYFTDDTPDKAGQKSSEARAFNGNFLVKRAKAYDLSFTTRFQGEWPRTIDAFKRNILLGSGYGSVSLAVDNNFLRILGETGLAGFFSFISIFMVALIYIKKIYPFVDSPLIKNLTLGFIAGTLGLLLNAFLIDVFEASKIAFSYWLLMGAILGLLNPYSKGIKLDFLKEFKNAIFSPPAIVIYLLIATIAVFMPLYINYFVGDDFTWLRWARDSQNPLSYFVNSNGFFYRPGARFYFLLMYKLFWLNETFYHFVSIILHFSIASVLFVLVKRVSKDYLLSIVVAFIFLILSSHQEAIFWISATGILFTSLFALLSILFYSYWKENQKQRYFALSLSFMVLSFFFHEQGVVVPLLLIAYDLVFENITFKKLFTRNYFVILSPLFLYLLLRLISQSHWFNGDYSYNLLKLPFNLVGNTFGYFAINLFGPQTISFYESLRNLLKNNLLLSILPILLFTLIVLILYKKVLKAVVGFDRKVILFGILFFLIALVPFLGLGNITSRYSYLSSVGFAIILALFVKNSFAFIKLIADKYTTYMLIFLLSLVFLSIQLFQVQSIHRDWTSSGEVVKKTIISFENIFLITPFGTYKNYSDFNHVYFVDVPTKKGEAWIFPVGLPDALSLALEGKRIKVDFAKDLDSALNASISDNADVFKFNPDGTLKKAYRAGKNIETLPRE